jgi:hypothetical protein
MDVEDSSIQENASESDNREKCDKRKREYDFSDPNERDVKKFCNEVQSMVISETNVVFSNTGYNSNGFGNSFQANNTNNFPVSNLSTFSNNSANRSLSQNYPSPLPSHFLNSANNNNNYSSSNNNPSNTFYQKKPELMNMDSSQMHSSIIIFVRTLTGRIIEIEANPQDTVLGLKERIQMRDGIPPANQRLIHQGKALSDSQILVLMGIKHRTTIHLVLGLTG